MRRVDRCDEINESNEVEGQMEKMSISVTDEHATTNDDVGYADTDAIRCSYSSRPRDQSIICQIYNLLVPILDDLSSAHVERALFRKHGREANKLYLIESRSLISNLRVLSSSSSSSSRIDDIRSGEISATELIAMTSSELAPSYLQQQRRDNQIDQLRERVKQTNDN